MSFRIIQDSWINSVVSGVVEFNLELNVFLSWCIVTGYDTAYNMTGFHSQ